MFDVIVEFPRMKVGVATRDERVVEVRYLHPSTPAAPPATVLGERAARQLERYREDPDAPFELPMRVDGSPFQRQVWEALCRIPRGETLSYGHLARALKAEARAVGQACGDNRLPLLIPCHRVVAANGIGGFAHATGGYLLEAKRWLLAHECRAEEFVLRP